MRNNISLQLLISSKLSEVVPNNSVIINELAHVKLKLISTLKFNTFPILMLRKSLLSTFWHFRITNPQTFLEFEIDQPQTFHSNFPKFNRFWTKTVIKFINCKTVSSKVVENSILYNCTIYSFQIQTNFTTQFCSVVLRYM